MRFRDGRAARRVGWTLAALFIGAGAAGASAPAGAVERLPAPIVAWTAPADCPNAESIAQRLMALAGGSTSRFADAGSVRGQVVKEGDEWVLSLQIAPVDTAGAGDDPARPARVLRAHDCDDLAEAGAVAIAIALGGGGEAELSAQSMIPSRIVAASIGPARTIAAPASIAPARVTSVSASVSESSLSPVGAPVVVDAPVEVPEADETPSDETPSDETPSDETRSTFAFVPSAGLVVDTASLGGAAFGPGAEAELRWAAFGASAYGFWLPRREISVASAQAVELSLLSAGLRGCYRAANELPIIDLCAGGEFGALNAAGKGLLDAISRRDPWGAATGGVLLGIDLGRLLRVGLRVEAALPLWRERYLVNQNDLVHEVPAATLRLGLLLAGSFGQH